MLQVSQTCSSVSRCVSTVIEHRGLLTFWHRLISRNVKVAHTTYPLLPLPLITVNPDCSQHHVCKMLVISTYSTMRFHVISQASVWSRCTTLQVRMMRNSPPTAQSGIPRISKLSHVCSREMTSSLATVERCWIFEGVMARVQTHHSTHTVSGVSYVVYLVHMVDGRNPASVEIYIM